MDSIPVSLVARWKILIVSDFNNSFNSRFENLLQVLLDSSFEGLHNIVSFMVDKIVY